MFEFHANGHNISPQMAFMTIAKSGGIGADDAAKWRMNPEQTMMVCSLYHDIETKEHVSSEKAADMAAKEFPITLCGIRVDQNHLVAVDVIELWKNGERIGIIRDLARPRGFK